MTKTKCKWGNEGYSHRGGVMAKETPKVLEDPHPWLKMIQVKRYEHFTRFCKVAPNGDVYYECYLNTEVDAEKKKRGLM